MKNVLMLAHDDAGQEARFQAALDIARALEGHLICVGVTEMPVMSGEFYASALDAELLADAREREETNRAALEARLAREDVPWNWLDMTGMIAPAVKDAARLADIVVLNRQLDGVAFPDMRGITAEVAIGSGKAVVAVPQDARGFRVGGRALVAWDGSQAAMHAVQAATPLLAIAERVDILEIEDGSVRAPAEDAAAYLSRYGIHATILRQGARGNSVSALILAEARGASYVVMGGFGHSRIAEALFGGTSRDLLAESPTPLVMAH